LNILFFYFKVLDASAPSNSKKNNVETVKPTVNVEKESLQKEHEKILKKGIPKGWFFLKVDD
jgi:poly(3-hydroxyalkanoate) synthetase